MLIVVDQALVQDLLRAVTPLEADVGSGFHVKIDSADTAFGDGVALVSMTGTASVGGASVGSLVTVLAAIDVVELHPVSGILECRVSILGVDAQDASALGHGDPVGRLTEALTRGLALAARPPGDPGERRGPPVDPGGGVEAPADRGRGPPAHHRRAAGQGVRGPALGLRGRRARPRTCQARGRRVDGRPRPSLSRLAAAALAGCAAERPAAKTRPGWRRSRTAYDRLHERLEKAAATEPLVASAFADRGQVVIGDPLRDSSRSSPGTWPAAIWIASRWT